MTADRQWLAIDWGFTVKISDEVANTGLNMSITPTPYNIAATDLNAIDIAVLGPQLIARMNTLLIGGNYNWADYSVLNTVRLAAVDVTNLEIGDAKLYEDPTPADGDTGNVPPQITVVSSLRSGMVTGAANYGRMYIPHTRMAQGTELATATTATALAAVGRFKDFLTGVTSDVQAQTVTPLVPFIITQKTGFASKPVAEVAVGVVMDTQRRRRNRLEETPQILAFP